MLAALTRRCRRVAHWSHCCTIPGALRSASVQNACLHVDHALQFGQPQTVHQRKVDPMHPVFKAVLVDAAGTLLIPSEPAAQVPDEDNERVAHTSFAHIPLIVPHRIHTTQVYLRYASKYGVTLPEEEVLRRFRKAYNTPWGRSHIRYVGDGRPFWYASRAFSHTSLIARIYTAYAQVYV